MANGNTQFLPGKQRIAGLSRLFRIAPRRVQNAPDTKFAMKVASIPAGVRNAVQPRAGSRNAHHWPGLLRAAKALIRTPASIEHEMIGVMR